MASKYPGLVKKMLANGIKRVIIDTPVGPRCFAAEMASSPFSGGRSVPQGRFICDGYCGLTPKRSGKSCKGVDQASMASLRGEPLPAGVSLPPAGSASPSLPYRVGEGAGSSSGGGGTGFFPTQPALIQ